MFNSRLNENNFVFFESSLIEQLHDINSYPFYIRLLKTRIEISKSCYVQTQSFIRKMQFSTLETVLNEEIQDHKRRLISKTNFEWKEVNEGEMERLQQFKERIKHFIFLAEKHRRLYLATDEHEYRRGYLGMRKAIKILLDVFEKSMGFQEQVNCFITAENTRHKRFLGFFAK